MLSRLATAIGLSLAMATGPAAAGGAAQHAMQQQAIRPRALKQHATQARDNAQAAAKRWHLTVQQWHRYQHLKQGLAKYRSNRLDPLTLLGIHAHTAAQRRAYAQKLARMEHDRVQGILAFQRAYDAAFKKLYPNQKAVVTTAGRALAQSRQTQQKLGLNTHRTAVFVDVHDCPACNRKVKKLVQANQPMDIYVLDAGDSDHAIRQWARQVGLQTQQVISGRITLNHASKRAIQQLKNQSLPRVVNAGGHS